MYLIKRFDYLLSELSIERKRRPSVFRKVSLGSIDLSSINRDSGSIGIHIPKLSLNITHHTTQQIPSSLPSITSPYAPRPLSPPEDLPTHKILSSPLPPPKNQNPKR